MKERTAYAKERASILRNKSSPTAAEAAAALLARVEVYFKNMKEDLDADAVLGPAGAEHPWVFLQAAASTVNEGTEAQAVDANLCQKCIKSLSKLPDPDEGYTHHMPRGARADGWWGGPMPVQISRLSALSAKIIRLAYVCQTILRVKLSSEDFARACASSTKHLIPEFVTGNALAVPLYVDSLPTVLGALPKDLSKHLHVQYIGEHAWLRNAPELLVSIPQLRAAFSWLLSHNWHWLETTFSDDETMSSALSPQLDALLEAYQKDLGGKDSGVPQTFVDAATNLKSAEAAAPLPGPVDAASDDPAPELLEASAAVMDNSVSESVVLKQVQGVMEIHESLMGHEKSFAMASNEEERQKSLELQVEDICRARQALERLSGPKLREELEARMADAKDTQSICKVGITAGETLLKSHADSFWQRCYVEIYPRGDCGENDRDTRKHRFQGREYSGHLFELFDKPWFREHKELNASFYKFFVRRDQMNAVGIEIKTNQKFKNDAETIHHLHSTDLKALAAKASDSAML